MKIVTTNGIIKLKLVMKKYEIQIEKRSAKVIKNLINYY